MNDYERIENIIHFLEQNQTRQPGLDELAHVADLSRFHFQRLFSAWAGVSPKSFLKSLTVQHAKELLRDGASALDTAYQTGLSGPGRLHDLCVSLESASPGEIKSGGHGWTIRIGFADSPFGECLIAECPRGVCHLSFVADRDRSHAEQVLERVWPNAEVVWDESMAKQLAARVFARRNATQATERLKAFVRGTEFQVRVWRALLELPSGTLSTYGGIASAIGSPKGARAVGSAVAQNGIAYLIPCHRVIRATGVIGEYRWGTLRKRSMIAWESAEMQ